MSAPAVLTPCPNCGGWLHGFKNACWAPGCGWVRPGDAPAKASAIPDTRSEEEIEAAIIGTLRTLGLHVAKLSQKRATQQTEGISDLIVFSGAGVVFAEIKRPGKEQSSDQRRFEGWVRMAGAEYRVWRSETEALAWARSLAEVDASREGAS